MKSKFIALLAGILIVFLAVTVNAQDAVVNRVPPRPLICGGGLNQDEFTTSRDERTYTISATAGTTINISIRAIASQQPRMIVLLTDPSDFGVAISDGRMDAGQTVYFPNNMQSQIQLNNLVLPATGDYTLRIVNFDFSNFSFANNEYMVSSIQGVGGVGAYFLSLDCWDINGDPIVPALELTPSPTTETNTVQETSIAGLIPNLVGVQTASLATGETVSNTINVGTDLAFAYLLEGKVGQQLSLNIKRLAGNLNVGLVVLSPSNELLSQFSMVGVNELTISILLPASGQYTIGVFRIDLLPPANPEETAYQLQATLSP